MNIEHTAELWNQTNHAGVQFVLLELEMALSFLDAADLTSDVERRRRLCASAKTAHGTILRFIPRFAFRASEVFLIDSKLLQMRDRLQLRGCWTDEPISVAA